jgi:hypothetical protein
MSTYWIKRITVEDNVEDTKEAVHILGDKVKFSETK